MAQAGVSRDERGGPRARSRPPREERGRLATRGPARALNVGHWPAPIGALPLCRLIQVRRRCVITLDATRSHDWDLRVHVGGPRLAGSGGVIRAERSGVSHKSRQDCGHSLQAAQDHRPPGLGRQVALSRWADVSQCSKSGNPPFQEFARQTEWLAPSTLPPRGQVPLRLHSPSIVDEGCRGGSMSPSIHQQEVVPTCPI